MSEALVKSSTFTIETEVAYGVDPATTPKVLETSGTPTFSDTYDTIERDIVRQAFSTYAPIRGVENTSGSFAVEAHGSGTYDTPLESWMAYRAAFGYLIGPNTDEADAAIAFTLTVQTLTLSDDLSYTDPQMKTGTLTMASTADLVVGYPFRIYDSTGNTLKLAGFITGVTTDTSIDIITSSSDASVSILDTDELDVGFMFTLRNEDLDQVVALPSLAMNYYRGDITKETYVGNIITEFSLDMSTGQLILPSFSWEGKTVSYEETSYGGGTTTYDSSTTSPLVMKLSDIFMEDEDGNVYQDCISNIQITITNEVFKKQCVATSGIGKVIRTKRTVVGSLNSFYEGKDFQDDFKNEKTYKLRAIVGYSTGTDIDGHTQDTDDIGNILAISIPQLKFSEVGIDEDSGIFKYNASFSCEPVDGDDEILLSWL